MTRHRLDCGFVPLVDAAPLVAAHEFGFAAEEGLDLGLHPQPSWSAIRDKLVCGALDAAHLLAPLAVAMSMGLGGMAAPVEVLSVLSVNGQVIGVSPDLAARLQDRGAPQDFADAAGLARALDAETPLRFGAPFPFSMHAELVLRWLPRPERVILRSIPPARMSEAMAAGEIDAFCVGEPWGSVAVEQGAARLILPGSAIWRFSPEKVLAFRAGWPAANPEAAAQLLRACWRAGKWLSDPSNHGAMSAVLSRAEYLDTGSDVIDRALSGRLIVSPDGTEREATRFVEFFNGAATFPWRSQALWIADRLAQRLGIDQSAAFDAARLCFRPDLYREILAPLGADLPGASEKMEGALDVATAVASTRGEMQLGPDRFFDGAVFDTANLPIK